METDPGAVASLVALREAVQLAIDETAETGALTMTTANHVSDAYVTFRLSLNGWKKLEQ